MSILKNIMSNQKKIKAMAELKGKILAGKILVQPQEAETKTASGIIIPDSAKEKPQLGQVVLTGEAKKDEPMEVKAGDTVFYGKYAGTTLQIDGVDYLLMSQNDVLYIQ
jgi:chaperonin GroES